MISKEDETYRRQKALHDEELIRDRIYKAESKSFFSGCMLGSVIGVVSQAIVMYLFS